MSTKLRYNENMPKILVISDTHLKPKMFDLAGTTNGSFKKAQIDY